jgi:hypothetical protein
MEHRDGGGLNLGIAPEMGVRKKIRGFGDPIFGHATSAPQGRLKNGENIPDRIK